MKATFLILLACLPLVAEANATLRIAAEPDALLPGLSPSLRIWITNGGTTPAEIPTRVALQVVPPRGEPFIAYTRLRGDEWTTDLTARRSLTLAPGETRDVSFWSRDEWFGTDSRFRTIGTFRLQLVADSGLDSQKLSGLPRVLDQPGLVQPLVSNETTFTSIEPTGADLAVWNVAKEQTETCTAEVTGLIWRDYPRSHYAAYCVQKPSDSDPMKQIAAYEASLAMSPPPHRANAYRQNIAREWMDRGWSLVTRDVDAAVDAYEHARRILETLARTAVAEEDRRTAVELLQSQVLTRERIVDLQRAAQGFDDRPLRFYASCFENLPGGSRKVWFGYNNPNSKAVDLAVGNDNRFTPPPFNRAQPTTFSPGILHFAFNIVTTEPSLVWHLQGKTARFKVPETIECPKGFDPNDPSTWQVEEE